MLPLSLIEGPYSYSLWSCTKLFC